jgi:hypothetical protein
MEPAAVRTESVNDLRPADSGSGTQRLVYILLWVIGFVLIILGAYARALEKVSWLPEVCIAAGVAIAAPGALSYLYRKYMLEEIKVELQKPAIELKETAVSMISEALVEVVSTYQAELDLLRSAQQAGIRGVYGTRGEALQAFMGPLEAERHDIMIVGSSLRGLLQEFDNEYEHARKLLQRKVLDNVRVRMLVTHPVVADFRARQEDRNLRDIGREIIESLRVLREDWKLPAANIKLYVGTPTVFAIRTADAMLINTYPYMKEAVASPSLIVQRPGYIYESYVDNHFRAWKSAMALEAPGDPTVLLAQLDRYAGQVKTLLESVASSPDDATPP